MAQSASHSPDAGMKHDGTHARATAALLVLAAVQFTNIVDFMIVMPLGPQLMRTMHISPRQFGLIVSSYTFAACIAGVLAALVIDRFDRKTAFLSLYVGFLIGTLCCGLANGYVALMAARFATGAFGGIMGGLAMAIIGDVFPESRRGAATGALMSAFAVASVAGVPIGLELGNRFDWHAPFLALAAFGVLVLVGSLFVLPSLQGHLRATGQGAFAEIRLTLTDANHLRAFALVVSLMFGGFLVVPYISAYLVANVGISEKQLPYVYVVSGALTLFVAPVIGKLADRIGKLKVYRAVAPLAAVMMMAVTTCPPVRLPIAVVLVAMLMVGNAGRMVVAMAMVTASANPRRRGSFMSLNSAVQHGSSGLGAFVAGLIILKDPQTGALTRYPWVGALAVVATLASLYLAGRLRVAHAAPLHSATAGHHIDTEVASVAKVGETR